MYMKLSAYHSSSGLTIGLLNSRGKRAPLLDSMNTDKVFDQAIPELKKELD
jgi:hypothetical protein